MLRQLLFQLLRQLLHGAAFAGLALADFIQRLLRAGDLLLRQLLLILMLLPQLLLLQMRILCLLQRTRGVFPRLQLLLLQLFLRILLLLPLRKIVLLL